MSWIRMSDDTATHPKLLELTRSERWQWFELLCLAARYRTNGRVSAGMLRQAEIRPKLLKQLRATRLLEANTAGELVIHDWNDYNGPGDHTNAERQRRYRERHGNVRKMQAQPDSPGESTRTPNTKPQEPSALEPESNALHVTPVTPLRNGPPAPVVTNKQAKGPLEPPARTSASLPAGQLETIGTSAEGEIERLRGIADEPPVWDVDEGSEGHEAA